MSRPAALAWYMAVSASRSMVSASVVGSAAELTRHPDARAHQQVGAVDGEGGVQHRGGPASASWRAWPAVATGNSTTANSSPPTRATAARRSNALVSRSPTSIRSWSPHAVAVGVVHQLEAVDVQEDHRHAVARPARPRPAPPRSTARRTARLPRPVSGSWVTWWSQPGLGRRTDLDGPPDPHCGQGHRHRREDPEHDPLVGRARRVGQPDDGQERRREHHRDEAVPGVGGVGRGAPAAAEQPAHRRMQEADPEGGRRPAGSRRRAASAAPRPDARRRPGTGRRPR